jgi:hypothetical protein
MADKILKALFCSCIAGILLTAPLWALDSLSVGAGGSIDWDGTGAQVATIDPEHRSLVDPNTVLVGNAPGGLIDFNHADFPGALLPRQLREGENIAPGTLERGGTINAPTILVATDIERNSLAAALEEILSDAVGGETQAFERKDDFVRGTLLISDLGARFGVNRIRFYPRNTVKSAPATQFQNDFLRAYEFFVNDGLNLSAEGLPLWGSPLAQESQNSEPVVDIVLDPPQYIRFFRLRAATPIPFEIDEIEIFGTGFLPTTTYLSDIFDVGLSSWGHIRWAESGVGDSTRSRLFISTRSGDDDTPFIFNRQRADLRDDPEVPLSIDAPTEPMRLAEYNKLPTVDTQGVEWIKGSIKPDLENWSAWTPPYSTDEGTADGGTPIISPSPRNYIQFRVTILSDDIDAARLLERVSLTYLTPPLADEFVAEIFPREVDVSKSTSFTYAVRPNMETSDLLGFDTFSITTPIRVEQVERVEILDSEGNLQVEHIFAEGDTSGGSGVSIAAIEDSRFSVRFPPVEQNGGLLKITFRAAVLAFSTEFRGQASLSSEAGSFQNATSGNSAELGAGDERNLSGTTVTSPEVIKSDKLVDALSVVPNPFTPNGDGINDQIAVTYNVLTLTKAGDVDVRLYDLSGRLVHTLQSTALRNGRYNLTWDGLDAHGELVPPGVYLIGVKVEGDLHSDMQLRPVAVVY